MPYTPKDTDHQNREQHSGPGNLGQPKGAGNKPLPADLDDEQRLAAEYTDDDANQTPPSITRHPNRHLDKPEVDKPPYGGGH